MDLIAVVTILDLSGVNGNGRTEEKLGVWRLNGQQVFGWDAPAGEGIQFVRWKMDGRLIALGTSDGLVRLLNVMNSGKMVHCLSPSPVEAAIQPQPSCLSWAVNFGDGKGMMDMIAEDGSDVLFDDLLSLGPAKMATAKMKADLPRELACGIDVESSIPKLSLLPPGTGAQRGWGFGGASGE